MKVNQKLAALLASTALMFVGIGANQAQAKPLSPNCDRAGNQLADKAGNLLLAQESKTKPEQYKFTLTNNTKKTIIVVAAADAESTNSVGTFDLEDGKIDPGQTATLVWDESTNNTGCKWAITVGFSDDSVAKPAVVDFCEENVSLEVK